MLDRVGRMIEDHKCEKEKRQLDREKLQLDTANRGSQRPGGSFGTPASQELRKRGSRELPAAASGAWWRVVSENNSNLLLFCET